MTRARKFSGKTVDEATEIALAELGAELEDVEIRVINTGRSGILGFGGEPAAIEVSPMSEGSADYDDEFEDSTEYLEASGSGSNENDGESEERSSGGRGRGRNRDHRRGRGRGVRSRNNRNARDGDEVEHVEAEEPKTEAVDRDEKQEEQRSSLGSRVRRGSRGGRGRGRGRNGRSKNNDAAVEQNYSEDRKDQEEPRPIVREKDEEAEQLVSELLDYFLGAMGVVAETYIRDDDEDGSLTFEIEGQDAGLLIGRRGETLQALQFIIRMVTNRQLGRKAYVVIDIEDYRERRIQMIRRIARRTAGRVASSGREDSLDPMSPAERRIVHMALANNPEVHTESEGEGSQRRVVIFPND
ncbi:MAG: hypothetical protein CL784_06175 [Chloroflexi bacterium]|nr:hypothetical protein [Chloroflexota bacterium]